MLGPGSSIDRKRTMVLFQCQIQHYLCTWKYHDEYNVYANPIIRLTTYFYLCIFHLSIGLFDQYFDWLFKQKAEMSWNCSRERFSWTFTCHDDVIKGKHYPRYWPFVRGIHRSPVNSPHKGQWREALMFSLICALMNSWVNNREAGDLRGNDAHYYVTVTYPWSPVFFLLERHLVFDSPVSVNCMKYSLIIDLYTCTMFEQCQSWTVLIPIMKTL